MNIYVFPSVPNLKPNVDGGVVIVASDAIDAAQRAKTEGITTVGPNEWLNVTSFTIADNIVEPGVWMFPEERL